jgi:hypothetical protein
MTGDERLNADGRSERRMQATPTETPPRIDLRLPHIALALCIAGGIALRIVSLLISPVTLDGDEAVTGIMVRRILDGTDSYIYFAGQKYNGSLEQYLQAGMYAIFRLPQTPFTLRLPEVALTAATTYACYWLARLVARSPWTAVFAAAIYAAGPFWNVFSGTRTIGAYPSTQLFAVLGVIAAMKAWGFKPGFARVKPSPDVRDRWCGVAGLSAGLILWLSLSGLEVLAAAAIWLAPVVLRSVRAAAAAAAGIVVGALPAIVWLLRYPGQLPGTGGAQPPTSALARAGHLYETVAGEFVGLSGPYGATWWWPHFAQHALVLALFAVWVAWAYVRRRGLFAILTLRAEDREPIDLILLIFPFAILLYIVSPYTWFVGTPRYLFVVYPIFAVALAAAGAHVIERGLPGWSTPRRPVVLSAVAVCVIALAVLSTTANIVHYIGPTDGRTTDSEIRQSLRFMQAQGDHYVYSEYWTAMPAYYFAANNKLQIAAWDFGDRFADVLAKVNSAPDFAYLTSSRSGEDYGPAVADALKQHGVSYRETRFGYATVFDRLSVPIRPQTLGFSSG